MQRSLDFTNNDFSFRVDVTIEFPNLVVCISKLNDLESKDCVIKISVDINRNSHMNDFLQTLKLSTDKKLSGITRALLCILLMQAVKENVLTLKSTVEINTIDRRYENFGFGLINGKMIASVNRLLNFCEQHVNEYSIELNNLLTNLVS